MGARWLRDGSTVDHAEVGYGRTPLNPTNRGKDGISNKEDNGAEVQGNNSGALHGNKTVMGNDVIMQDSTVGSILSTSGIHDLTVVDPKRKRLDGPATLGGSGPSHEHLNTVSYDPKNYGSVGSGSEARREA